MKKTSRTTRPSVDTDHLAKLHREAVDVLSLLSSALMCASSADGEVRDMLDTIAQDHLTAYLDLLHTISLHDTSIGCHFSSPPNTSSVLSVDRPLRPILVEALRLRHERLGELARTEGRKRFCQDDILDKEKRHLSLLVHLFTT